MARNSTCGACRCQTSNNQTSHAFRSDRVYHKGLSHAETKRILIDGKGTQFDPRLVDLFLERENELLKLAELYRER